MIARAEPPASPQETMLEAMAEVMERQARVARAEAALAAARRRLADSVGRLSVAARDRGEGVDLPPLAAAVLEINAGLPAPPDEDRGTLRSRVLAAVAASPGEVFTPARLAPMVGARNRDTVRNALLTLASKGLIVKVDDGRYQARAPEAGP